MTRRGPKLLGPGLLVLVILFLNSGLVPAQHTAPARPTPIAKQPFSTEKEITPAMRTAVDQALAWLARGINQDGSFGSPSARIAVTAIAALSFMASGSTADRGPYQREVSRAIRYLIQHVSTDPEHRGYIILQEDLDSKMHGHGFATLALAEALGTYGNGHPERLGELKRGLEAAIRLIERAQSDAGGWYYHPTNDGNHEGSITVCMLQALRAARNAGIHVKKRVIDKAVRYMEQSAERRNGLLTGAFKYSLVDTQVSFALTAAAVSTLQMCGEYDSNLIRHGLNYMDRELDQHLTQGDFYYYGVLYASQAYFQVGGNAWRKHFPLIRDSLLKHVIAQDEDDPRRVGAFGVHLASQEIEYGEVYATAMATLTLQIPYQFLPIFQK